MSIGICMRCELVFEPVSLLLLLLDRPSIMSDPVATELDREGCPTIPACMVWGENML